MMQLSWPMSGEKVVAVAPGISADPKVIGSLLTLYWCSQAAYRLGITVMLPTCHVYWAWNPKSVTHDSSLSLWISRRQKPTVFAETVDVCVYVLGRKNRTYTEIVPNLE